MSALKITLSLEEKRFLVGFYIGRIDILTPSYKKWVSLYSYLDNTQESLKDQRKFNEHEDLIIAETIRKIGNNVDNEILFKQQIKYLKLNNIEISDIFYRRYENASKWFWYEESNNFIEALKNKCERKLKIIENKLQEKLKTNFENNVKHHQIAMQKLGANRFNIRKNIPKKDKNILHQHLIPQNYDSFGQLQSKERKLITSAGLKFFKELIQNRLFEKEKYEKKIKDEYWGYSNESISLSDKLTEINSDILHIQNIISSTEKITQIYDFEKIRFGAVITLKNKHGIIKYKLVGSDEIRYADEIKNILNEGSDIQYLYWASPLGKCLIGKEAGDSIEDLFIANYQVISFHYP